MARIPILKLNNGSTNYYPFSVGEATVTTHDIEVVNDIGGYKAGDTIKAVTTLDEILTKLFSNQASGTGTGTVTPGTATAVDVDGVTIIKDDDGKIKIGTVDESSVTGLSDNLEKINTSINNLKFTKKQKFQIETLLDVCNIVKDILIKLGATEKNITVDETAVTKTEDEVGPDKYDESLTS